MFFEFGIKDFIDILLAAFLLYYTYKLMRLPALSRYSPVFWFLY